MGFKENCPLFTPFVHNFTPVGETKFEAQGVAWSLTLAAFAPEAVPAATKKLCYASALDKKVPKVSGVAKRLAAMGATVIPIEEIETELGDDFWSEVFPTDQVVDPHYWTCVASIVKSCVENMLTKLDISLCSLSGMDFEQTTAAVYSDLCGVKSVIKNELGAALLCKRPGAVLECLESLRSDMLGPRVEVVKTRLKKQIAGVYALQRVLRAALSGRPDHAILTNEDDLRIVFLDPPECMVQDLSRRNVHLSVPSSCFQCAGTLPMSASTKMAVLKNWINANAVCVGEVCASTLSLLKRLVAVHNEHNAWSQVTVAKYEEVREWHSMVHCPLPEHLATRSDLVLFVPPKVDCVCVRAARLFDALVQLAKKGFLKQRHVRADMVLPLFARVEVEQGAVLQNTLAEMEDTGAQHGVPFAVGAKRTAAESPEVSDDEIEEHPSLQTTAAVVSVLNDSVCVGVRAELQRDHAILHSICTLLKRNQAQSIRLKDIAEVFVKVAPHINSNPRSLNQAISKVATKAIQYFNASKQTGYTYGNVRYDNTRDRATDGHVGGIILDAHGAATFLNHCAGWCSRMKSGDKSVVSDWKPSRASLAQATHAKQRRRHGSNNGTKSRGNKCF